MDVAAAPVNVATVPMNMTVSSRSGDRNEGDGSKRQRAQDHYKKPSHGRLLAMAKRHRVSILRMYEAGLRSVRPIKPLGVRHRRHGAEKLAYIALRAFTAAASVPSSR
jgi:hypothetical protein